MKKILYGLFYFNNEFSRTSLFLFTFFILAVLGIIGLYTSLIPTTNDLVDMVKYLVAIVVGGKTVDSVVTQVLGSPIGKPAPPKNTTVGGLKYE